MAHENDTSVSTRRSSDTMTTPVDSQPTVIDIPEKIEPEKSSLDDGKPIDESKEKAKDEKEGSMKDYFVSNFDPCKKPS